MPRHHPRFYFPGTDDFSILQVEDYLFRVSRSHLADVSNVFADLFALPQDPSSLEGQSDDHPIYLSLVPLLEFEQLLSYIYSDPDRVEPSGQALLARIAAAVRWDAPAVQATTTKQLAAMDNPVAQLIAARLYNIESWIWPALFAICMRPSELTAQEKSTLDGADYGIIHMIRRALKSPAEASKGRRLFARLQAKSKSAGHVCLYTKEERLRQLLQGFARVPEPLMSDLRPPASGYRLRLRSSDAFPYALAGEAPFRDLGGEPVYIGSALIMHENSSSTRAIIPCKLTPRITPDHHVSWGGRETWGTQFELLPFDSQRMEWIEASSGQVPKGRSPIRGGYDADGTPLFHAYGTVQCSWNLQRIQCPGKTGKASRGASLPFAGGEHIVEHDYHILVWKPMEGMSL
jgi:hypothetical protein